MIRKLLGNRYASDSLLMMATGALSGVLFLLVHSVLGRTMPDPDYAAFVSLLAVLNILSVPSSTFRVVIARYIAEHALGDRWCAIIRRAMRRMTLWGVAGLALWLAAAPVLQSALHAPSVRSVCILGGIAFVSLYLPLVHGALQGRELFGWMAASSLANAAGRLVLVWIVSIALAGVSPTLAAVGLSMVISIVIAYVPIRNDLSAGPMAQDLDTRPIYRYLWTVLPAQAAVFVLMNADVVLFNRFLSEADAAVFSKAAVLSRTIVFLPQPIALAMFPRAVASRNPWIIGGPFLFSFGLALAAGIFIMLFPALPLKLMYGVEGAAYEGLLKQYIWAVQPLSLTLLLTQYLWARDRHVHMLALIPAVAAYLVMLFLYHDSPTHIAICLAAGSFLCLVTLSLILFRMVRQPGKEA